MYPRDLKYTKEHEWIRVEGDEGTVGITHFAQKELGDIVFVELPEEGEEVVQGDSLAVIESVKAVSDVYSPISGTIIQVNQRLEDEPELINKDPYDEGWIVVIKIKDKDELEDLMSNEEYQELLEGEED
jgi:glycine cleavage system H protein